MTLSRDELFAVTRVLRRRRRGIVALTRTYLAKVIERMDRPRGARR